MMTPQGDVDAVEILLMSKADNSAKDGQGLSALAIHRVHAEMCYVLLRYGPADQMLHMPAASQGATCLHQAAALGSPRIASAPAQRPPPLWACRRRRDVPPRREPGQVFGNGGLAGGGGRRGAAACWAPSWRRRPRRHSAPRQSRAEIVAGFASAPGAAAAMAVTNAADRTAPAVACRRAGGPAPTHLPVR
jgi:hypothetical protein